MNSFPPVLSHEFVAKRISLTWRDILYAINRKFFAPQAAIRHAMIELSKVEECSQSLIELASLTKGDPIHPYLEELAASEPEQSIGEVNNRWIYLLLAWTFENKERIHNPLDIVDQIYAYFDYPEQLSGFIRYMPSDEPDLGSLKLNEIRLYKKWKDYLCDQEIRYAPVE